MPKTEKMVSQGLWKRYFCIKDMRIKKIFCTFANDSLKPQIVGIDGCVPFAPTT